LRISKLEITACWLLPYGLLLYKSFCFVLQGIPTKKRKLSR
jgi:hypothetical protein